MHLNSQDMISLIITGTSKDKCSFPACPTASQEEPPLLQQNSSTNSCGILYPIQNTQVNSLHPREWYRSAASQSEMVCPKPKLCEWVYIWVCDISSINAYLSTYNHVVIWPFIQYPTSICWISVYSSHSAEEWHYKNIP